MNREQLERPFAPAQIRQRKGRNGLLDYVEGHSVIQRLNEALEGAWSFEIVHHEIREEEVLVLGKLTAEGITKMQFGASQVTRERESGALVSLGDDLKAAATDCIKKCATFLGVGLHLYAEKPIGGTRPGGTRRRGAAAAHAGADAAGPDAEQRHPAGAQRSPRQRAPDATASPAAASRRASSTRSGRWGRPRGSTRTRSST